MESDRKRKLSVTTSTEQSHPHKKSDSDETNFDLETVTKQKKAALREINVYRKTVEDLEKQNSSLKNNLDKVTKELLQINRYWSEFDHIILKISEKFPNYHSSKKTKEQSEDLISKVFRDENLAPSLEEKKKFSSRLCESVLSFLSEKVNGSNSSEGYQQKIHSLQTENSSLLKKFGEQEDQVKFYEIETKRLNDRIVDFEIELEKNRRTIERLKDTPKNESTTNTVDHITNSSSGSEGWQEIAEKRLKEIETFKDEKIQILKELDQYKRSGVDVPEDKIISSFLYKKLLDEKESYHARARKLQEKLNILQMEFEREISHKQELKRQWELKEKQRLEKVDYELKNIEKEKIQLKEESSKLSIQLSQHISANQELKSTISNIEKQLRIVKNENERSKGELQRLRSAFCSQDKEALLAKIREQESRIHEVENAAKNSSDPACKRVLEELLSKILSERRRSSMEMKNKIEELEKTLAFFKEEQKQLYTQVDQISREYEELQQANTKLIQAQKEKEEANTKLMAENARLSRKETELEKEKEIISSRHDPLNKKIDAQNELVKKLELSIKQYKLQLANYEKEKSTVRLLIESHESKASQCVQKIEELEKENEKLKMKLSKESAIDNKVNQSHEISRLQEQIMLLKRKIPSDKKIESDELIVYKRMVKCSVCETREKDTILSRCGHLFCRRCIETRIETRQRKCPICNDPFGANDLKHAYL